MLWLFLRGLFLWIIWTSRNHLVFKQDRWPDHYLYALLWFELCDYGHVAWSRCRQVIKYHPERSSKVLEQFDNLWAHLYPQRSQNSVD
jgi:hypothetical protein